MCSKLLVFAACVSLVAARPDIGLKIREGGIPAGSYLPQQGAPSYAPSQQVNFASTSYGVPSGFPHYTGFVPPQHYRKQSAYFFDAPEDLGQTHVRVHVQPSAAAGDKTIYIRAPAYNSRIIPHFNIAQQQQPAGKTKVYVLVKKPEEQQDIVVPAGVQAPAAEPEVVFVKYRNQKEAEEKLKSIQDGSIGGDSAKVVGNHQDLVHSIEDPKIDVRFGSPAYDNNVAVSAPNRVQEKPTANYGPAGISGPY
ncbi:PREDICTED: uncharacterized protein LOC108567630 [Nicrophorus vespilloides]|uniref:Uncharacterized protein LOC108567630 n=1 Tax=Nicrophorus vespilloides TaxID=110193 RepID=A0ABM1NA61_NICVS|nr:PREDICTED: uncharacterized protein LOC108567630 [Nicrophorus vespilloides]